MKAETNLTDQAWLGWQITLGEGCSLPPASRKHAPVSRQFTAAEYLKKPQAIVFTEGEVRPGEPILKLFSIRLKAQGPGTLVMSHNRLTNKARLREMRKGTFGHEFPKADIHVPVRVV